MKKRIIIAANSFKECADSVTAAGYFEENLGKNSGFVLTSKPVSDGGDGFLEVCRKNFTLRYLKYRVSTPYDNSKITCIAGYNPKDGTIYIESANILGLKVIPVNKRHPVKLSSKGMGDLLIAIAKDVESGKINVSKVIIGIGGTGINDMGLGMCSRLGLSLFDRNGKELEVIPGNFNSASSLVWSRLKLPFDIEVIADVKNPLLGKNGATYIYGKQKGLAPKEIKEVEAGFRKIMSIMKYDRMPERLPGAGGGLAAGFKLFLNAEVKSSEHFILDDLGFCNMKNFDFAVLTEGAFDKQSLMGKATGSLIRLFDKYGVRIILCTGKAGTNVKKLLPNGTEVIELRKYFKSESESIKNFRKGIRLASGEIIRIINS